MRSSSGTEQLSRCEAPAVGYDDRDADERVDRLNEHRQALNEDAYAEVAKVLA